MRYIVFALALLICFPALSSAVDLAPVSGTYFSQRDNTQFLTLRPDGTFVLKQRKKPPDPDNPFVEFSGSFAFNGDTVTLKLDDGGKADGHVKGDVFTDAQNEAWTKKGEEKDVVRPKYKPLNRM
jgi:hypothetical protein